MEEGKETTSLFDRWRIIGEGTDFLVVQIECPGNCASPDEHVALALDADGLPVRRITGFPHRPQPARNDAIWFFFVLFDPSDSPAHLRESRHIRFTLKNNGKRIEQTIAYVKKWGSGDQAPRIYDGPLPPEVVSGRLVLCDYVFWADGDPRSPAGAYVSARIHGAMGRWHGVEVVSDVEGMEDQPELQIETDRGWLELATGRSHSMQEAIAPASPYVEGWWDGKGCFHPDPPNVR